MLDAAINWLSAIDPAIWGSFIAGAMTLSGVVLGQLIIQGREESKKEEEIESLRDALIVELRTYDSQLEQFVKIVHDLEKAREDIYGADRHEMEEMIESDLKMKTLVARYAADSFSFSNDVYQSNTDKIGLLDSEVAGDIVEAYTNIMSFKQSLGALKESVSYAELIELDVEQETDSDLLSTVHMAAPQIEGTATQALICQKMALWRLGSEQTQSDRAIVLFALRHIDAQSQRDELLQQLIEKQMEDHNTETVEDLIQKLDNKT